LEECPETDLFWRRSLARVLGIEEDVLDLSHDFLNDPYRDS